MNFTVICGVTLLFQKLHLLLQIACYSIGEMANKDFIIVYLVLVFCSEEIECLSGGQEGL